MSSKERISVRMEIDNEKLREEVNIIFGVINWLIGSILHPNPIYKLWHVTLQFLHQRLTVFPCILTLGMTLWLALTNRKLASKGMECASMVRHASLHFWHTYPGEEHLPGTSCFLSLGPRMNTGGANLSPPFCEEPNSSGLRSRASSWTQSRLGNLQTCEKRNF